MALGPKEMGEAIVRNLKTKTGKDINEWVEIIDHSNLTEKKQLLYYLKTEHSLGHFQAQKIYEYYHNQDHYSQPQDLVKSIFASTHSYDIYKQLEQYMLSIGNVSINPCKTYVPFYAKNQFAITYPSPQDEVVLALNLPPDAINPPLIAGAHKGSNRITAHVKLTNSNLSSEVKHAILLAFNNNCS